LSLRFFDELDDLLDFANRCFFLLFVRDQHLAKTFKLVDHFVKCLFFLEECAELRQSGKFVDKALMGIMAQFRTEVPRTVV